MKESDKQEKRCRQEKLAIWGFRPLFFLDVLCVLSVFLLSACTRTAESVSRQGFYFDTVIRITLYGTGDEALLDHCFALAGQYEDMLSRTKEGSDVWKLNHAEGGYVRLNEDTLILLRTALSYAELTDGGIDPTIGSVNKLWDFTGGTAVLPDEAALAQALSHVDYRAVTIDGDMAALNDPQAELDLGFIAKGYIADRMKEYLVSRGVDSALINLGGNVLAIGNKPDGTPFKVGIQQPFAAGGVTALTLPVTDLSVVSSGNYERFFEYNGKIYHHILDTQTGCPVWNNLSGVTVLCGSSMEGDALSTACFVLGAEKGMALIESLPDTEAVFLTSDGDILYSDGISP